MASATRALWSRWVIAFTVGEVTGFSLPVAFGALALWLARDLEAAPRTLMLYAAATVGGFGEGAVLAWFQSRVVREHWPRLDARRWIWATGLAAAFAWACGMLAPTLDDLFGLSIGQQLAIWIPASVLILVSIGVAQARVLVGVVATPWRWLIANVVGWIAGLPWTFALPALLPDEAPVVVWVLTFIVAGALMGLTTGAMTGAWVLRLPGYRAGGCAACDDPPRRPILRQQSDRGTP